MKKLFTTILALVMTVGVLAGCGGNPVQDDLANFTSTELTAPMEKMDELMAEMDKWSDPGLTIEDVQLSLEKMVPVCDEALQLAEGMNTSTEEVTALKNQFVDSLKKYKEGFAMMLEGMQDDAKFEEGSAKVEEGTAALNTFNADLEALATANGLLGE